MGPRSFGVIGLLVPIDDSSLTDTDLERAMLRKRR
jgi:hypothetical protein